MKIIQNHRSYVFKPSFLDKMTGIQLQSWVEAAEQILRDNKITFDKTIDGGHLAFRLNTEDDYRQVCNLSLDIGMRALSIEAEQMSLYSGPLHQLNTAGTA